MSSRWLDRIRRIVATVMITALVGGCTGHVEIPREQFDAAPHDEYLSHRIRTTKTEFIARRFSFTDSTLVITELAPGDVRYRLENPPFVVPREEIESIAGVKSKEYVPFVVFGAIFVGMFLLIRASTGAWSE